MSRREWFIATAALCGAYLAWRTRCDDLEPQEKRWPHTCAATPNGRTTSDCNDHDR